MIPNHTDSFSFAPSVQLVNMGTIQSLIGQDGDTVIAMIEEGRWLRHGFDLSAGRGLRAAYRVARCCLLAWSRKDRCTLSDSDVIAVAIGVERPRLRSAELVIGWQLTRAHVLDLVRAGHLQGTTVDHTLWVDRKSAVQFLTRRRLGGERSKMPQDGLGGDKTPPRDETHRKPAAIGGREALRFGSNPVSSPGGGL